MSIGEIIERALNPLQLRARHPEPAPAPKRSKNPRQSLTSPPSSGWLRRVLQQTSLSPLPHSRFSNKILTIAPRARLTAIPTRRSGQLPSRLPSRALL
ncbi:hypothetical protein [Kamptonema formosum]|uniref:hypothetical protein n=1 Tax=Kamptonema formosum TaxID=331992 RepID=UPI00034603AB|nr:hypothetical protein [Oscillatoria sp. PCC 10802]